MGQFQQQNKQQLIKDIKRQKLEKQATNLIPYKLKERKTEEEQWNGPNNKLTFLENQPLSTNTESLFLIK